MSAKLTSLRGVKKNTALSNINFTGISVSVHSAMSVGEAVVGVV